MDYFDQIIKLGTCAQGANGEMRKIEWIPGVIDILDDRIFLISKYMLFPCYKETKEWEKTEIRKYLNTEFYKSTFSSEEKEKLLDFYTAVDKTTNRLQIYPWPFEERQTVRNIVSLPALEYCVNEKKNISPYKPFINRLSNAASTPFYKTGKKVAACVVGTNAMDRFRIHHLSSDPQTWIFMDRVLHQSMNYEYYCIQNKYIPYVGLETFAYEDADETCLVGVRPMICIKKETYDELVEIKEFCFRIMELPHPEQF